jgi:hypothetical protein
LAGAWQALVAIGAEGRRSRGSEARARIVRDYELGIIAARYEALYTDIAARDAASPIAPRAGTSAADTSRLPDRA